jgi:hypothetical protein
LCRLENYDEIGASFAKGLDAEGCQREQRVEVMTESREDTSCFCAMRVTR